MTLTEYYLVYPDGDRQEIERPLRMNEVVDMNGGPLAPSWPPPRIVAYRIYRVSTDEGRGIVRRLFFAELMDMNEIASWARSGGS